MSYGNPSPFIPPMGSLPDAPPGPSSARAAGVTTPATAPAGWPGPAWPGGGGGYTPFHGYAPYPAFNPAGPYSAAGTPYVPFGAGPSPGSLPHFFPGATMTPNAAVQHYFPGTPNAGPPAGVSNDYTGYPGFTNPSPNFSSNHPGLQPNTPAAPAASLGWAGPGSAQNPPQGLPGWSQQNRSQIPFPGPPQPPYPGQFGGPMGGRPPPWAGGGGGWGGHTPAMAFPTDLWGGQTSSGPVVIPGMMGGGPGMAPMMRPGVHGDKISPWSSGPGYGPVLDPSIVKIVGADLQLNPLLNPPPDDLTSRDFLKWNMLFRTNHCQRSSEPAHASWSKGRDEPATFPRVNHIRLVCQNMPYTVEISARSPDIGVTCGDVIEQLSENLYRLSGATEFHALPADRQHRLGSAYTHNRSREHGVPGGSLGEGMRRLDWLGDDAVFGGIQKNDKMVKKMCGDVLPCTFELLCVRRWPMNAQEIREHEARSRAISESERRDAPDGSGRASRASRHGRHRSTVTTATDES
ncbi:hypothetical protein C8J56DRAFT_915207 [Mycena floridula]|nr:hypothetical protein C8J56DRAFT_915207 [Mycena floridula]